MPKIEALLARGAWYSGLPKQLPKLLLANGQLRRFGRGDVIIAAGEMAGLYVVLHGTVALSQIGAVGNEILYYIARPGFWFGLLGVLVDRPLNLTATADSESTLVVVPRAEILQLLDSDHRYRDALSQLAHERFALELSALEQTSRPSVIGRVAAKLLSVRELDMQTDYAMTDAALPISQSALALMTSLSRQSVSTALGALVRAGAIEVGFRKITIVDLERLDEIANAPAEAQQQALRSQQAPQRWSSSS